MSISFKSKIDLLDKLKMHYVSVTEELLKLSAIETDKTIYNQRFKVTINNSVSWLGGTVSLGDKRAYIALSKARMKQLNVGLGDVVNVELIRDHSEFGFDVPEEWVECLAQDPEAQRRFNSLTKGKQRAIIYLVIQLKSSDKKIEKSLFFLENLKRAPEGKITMRHALGKDLP